MRRVLCAVLVCAAASALVPGAAAAHSLVRSGGGLVSYTSADATSLNGLAVRPSGNRVEFRDDRVDGGMDPGTCTPGAVDNQGFIVQTFCSLDGVRRVRIDLGDREDTAAVSLRVPVTLLGGTGADGLTAGPLGDEVSGGEGNDSAAGGEGDDVLSGDQGVDVLDGGAGADRIAARDGEADTVRCGPGGDTVDADGSDLVAADCEGVTRTATASPTGPVDDGKPPVVDAGAPTLQRIGRSRVVRVYATTSERGALGASGFLEATGLTLPIKRVPRKRIAVAGGGAELRYRLTGRHWRLARRALQRGKPVVVRLAVVATDLSGQSSRRNAPEVRLLRTGNASSSVTARAAHPEPGDVDGDEVRDIVDNCPLTKNGGQVNTDRSTEPVPGVPGINVLGDACDTDDDADGVPDAQPDNCRTVFNPVQEPEADPTVRRACPPVDDDRDGLVNDDDNCDLVPNPAQTDLDGDDRGDACDRDRDGDDFDDGFDNCPTVYNLEATDVNGDGLVNDQLDRDRDGIGTACDPDEPAIGAPPPPRPGTPDRSRPRLSAVVGRRHRLAEVRAGLVVRLRCSEACGATAELVLNRATARRLGLRRSRVVAGGSARLEGRGTTYAFVRFTKKARRALFRRGPVRATLTATAVDPAGNTRILKRRVELRR